MSEITITVDDREVRAMLQRAPARINRALRAGMEDATAHTLRQVQTYPTQRSGSNYKRTGNLRRSWSRRIRGQGLAIEGVVGSNENIAPYNRRVQDITRQADVHRGRWLTVQQVAANSRAQIQRMFDDRLRAELR